MSSRFAFLALLVFALAGCATPPKIVQEWNDSAFTGGPFKRILVVGVTKDATLRRVFEDEFSAQLRARNVEAVQSYTLIPEDGKAPRERVDKAVHDARADAAVVTRVLRVERRIEVVPMAPPFYPGFYGYYGAAWGGPLWMGYAQPPAVLQYDQVYVESQLLDTKSEGLVWSAVGELFAPDNPKQDSAAYSRVIIDALAARKLI